MSHDYAVLLNDKRKKEYEVQDLQDEISKIKAARTQLEQKGQADLLIFTTNITAISKIWVDVQGDAELIQKWLNEGAEAAVSDGCGFAVFTAAVFQC